MAAESSTLPNQPNNETVTLKLPTGEMIDAIVPGGMSDDQVKSFVQTKRPDLFSTAPTGMSANRKQYTGPDLPQGGEVSGSKVPQSIMNAPDSLGEAISGITAGGAGALGASGASAAIAPALPFLGAFARKYPAASKIIGSEAISQARKIPYVGKLVPAYAEMLPWLRGGK